MTTNIDTISIEQLTVVLGGNARNKQFASTSVALPTRDHPGQMLSFDNLEQPGQCRISLQSGTLRAGANGEVKLPCAELMKLVKPVVDAGKSK
jgi:hypothetical protein